MPSLTLLSRVASILLLGILLFSTGGYRLFFDYLSSRHAAAQTVRFNERDYEEASLITLKAPLNLPYFTNAPEWERMSGEITVAGKVYQYVERRIFNDSIEVRCLPDEVKTGIQFARDQFFALAHDLLRTSSNSPIPKSAIVKPFAFEGFSAVLPFALPAPSTANYLHLTSEGSALPTAPSPPSTPPPDCA